jgi:hypothetical protein
MQPVVRWPHRERGATMHYVYWALFLGLVFAATSYRYGVGIGLLDTLLWFGLAKLVIRAWRYLNQRDG